MNKFFGLWLMVVLSILSTGQIAWSYPVADSVRYPLDSYVVGANHFGTYGLVRANKWHLGDDVAASAETNVFAIGNGLVKRAQIQTDYGGVYIIEHDVNGEKICALFAHMNFATFTKAVGQEVVKGEYLGQIGNSSQNGGWPEHFHFGIHKGAYPADPTAYICGDWIFSGYTACKSVLDDWHNPSEFIANHGQIITPARFSDGTIHQPILDAFNRYGGSEVLGWPIDDGGGVFVHFWLIPDQPPQNLCQNFRNASGQESIIMHGAPYTGQAHLISGEIWEYYRYGYVGADEVRHYGPDIRLSNGKTLGCPMSDEENGVQWFGVNGERRGYYSKRLLDFLPAKSAAKTAAKAGMETTEQTYVIAVDLHQTDGTLVETYNPDGSFCALTLTAQPMSPNHNALAWLGGPVASSYRVLADGGLKSNRLSDMLNLA